MSTLLSGGPEALLALIPALVAVYAGCILFVLILALLGCRILSKKDRS